MCTYMYMNDTARQMYTPKAASDFQRKIIKKNNWAALGRKSRVLDGCSINWATEAAQLAESNPKMLDNAMQSN